MLDVLHLLAVPWGLLQRLDDKRSSRGNNRAGGLPDIGFEYKLLPRAVHLLNVPVLDPQLHSDLESLPVRCGLGNVVTNLLGGQTKWADLKGE